jgi:hypothetical protein
MQTIPFALSESSSYFAHFQHMPVELVLSVAQVHFMIFLQLILHWEEELNGDKKLIR